MNTKTQGAQANGAKAQDQVTKLEEELKTEKANNAKAEDALNQAKNKAEDQVAKLQKDLEAEKAAKAKADKEIKSLQDQLAETKSNSKAGKSKSSDKQERRTFTLLTNARVNGQLKPANKPCELTEQQHAELFAQGGVNADWDEDE